MELWTPEHTKTLIPTVIIFLVITVILRLTLKNKPRSIRMIPLQIIACLIFVMEAGKQLASAKGSYDLYSLPFHFCSLFIFMLPLMAFYRGKYANRIAAITCALSAAMTLLLLVYPNLIYPPNDVTNFFKDYLAFHSVAFHALVMLCFFLMVALELHTPEMKGEVRSSMVFTLGFCVISATMANLLETNFNNFYTCNIPPLEAIRASIQEVIGKLPAQIIYSLIVTVVDILFVAGCYWLYRLVRRMVCGKANNTAVK